MKLHTIAAAALLTSFTLPVMANTDAAITLGDFAVTLKDLKPADGVAPTLSWGGDVYSSTFSSDQRQLDWHQSGGIWYESWGNEPGLSDFLIGPGSLDHTSHYGNSTQQVETTSFAHDSIALTAHAEQGQNVNAQGSVSRSFTLSAGTQATFSMAINGSWSGIGYPGTGLVSGGSETSSWANVSASMVVGPNNAYWNAGGSSVWFLQSDAFDSEIDGQVLKLTVKNNSAADASYFLTVQGSATAMEATTPVPEPSSYAMLGSGLALLGFMARRRRS